MQELILNDALILSCPDGFHMMSEDERSRMRLLAEGKWIGLSDPERHILVTAGWRPAGLAGALLSAGDLSRGAEKKVRSAMRGLDYRLEGFSERGVAGGRAGGFRYAYTAGGVEMLGESVAMKQGKTLYYFQLYARAALRGESLAVWDELLRFVRKK